MFTVGQSADDDKTAAGDGLVVTACTSLDLVLEDTYVVGYVLSDRTRCTRNFFGVCVLSQHQKNINCEAIPKKVQSKTFFLCPFRETHYFKSLGKIKK